MTGRSVICFINNYFPSLSEPFIYREVMGLRERGLRIRTFSIRRPAAGEVSEESMPLMDATTYLLPVKTSAFIEAHLRFFLAGPLAYVLLFFVLMTRKYDRAIRDRIRTFFHFCEGVYLAKLIQDDPRIIHIHSHYASHPATLAYVASALTGIPFTFTAHAYDIWEDRLFVPEKVNAAGLVITCSLYGKKALLGLHGIKRPGKVITVYHGVDTNKFRPKKKPGGNGGKPFVMLNVGRLCKDKGQEVLIRACRILKNEGRHFVCKIVGEGPLRPYLVGEIAANDLTEEVLLCGKVFQEEILRHYQEADVFVLSSVQENLPNVLLESLAAGAPVVATRLAGTPELIKDGVTGMLVAPGDATALASAIKRVMDDPALARALSKQGREWVCARFDVQKSLDSLQEVYRGILEQSERGCGLPTEV